MHGLFKIGYNDCLTEIFKNAVLTKTFSKDPLSRVVSLRKRIKSFVFTLVPFSQRFIRPSKLKRTETLIRHEKTLEAVISARAT